MVGSESVSARMRNRVSRPKLAPLTMSVAKWEAVEALPPLPHTKMRRCPARACERISIACPTLVKSIEAIALSKSSRYCWGKVIRN